MVGNRIGPNEAYRFARGEQITSSTGQAAKLQRPLDFLVVADHAENLGLAPMIAASDPILLKNATGKKWHDMVKAGNGFEAFEIPAEYNETGLLKGRILTTVFDETGRPVNRQRLTAITFIAMLFSVMVAPWPLKSSHFPPTIAPIRKSCGNGCRLTRTEPAVSYWRFHITETSVAA